MKAFYSGPTDMQKSVAHPTRAYTPSHDVPSSTPAPCVVDYSMPQKMGLAGMTNLTWYTEPLSRFSQKGPVSIPIASADEGILLGPYHAANGF